MQDAFCIQVRGRPRYLAPSVPKFTLLVDLHRCSRSLTCSCQLALSAGVFATTRSIRLRNSPTDSCSHSLVLMSKSELQVTQEGPTLQRPYQQSY
jgi:hypothetical protein